MRVLIDTGGLGRGGAERQTVQLASGLIARGHACVLVVNKSVCEYGNELRSGSVPARVLGRDNRFDVRLLDDLIRVVTDFAPDVVLSVGFSATLWGRLAAKIRHVPSVTAEHGTHSQLPWKVTITNRMLAGGTAATVSCAREQVASLLAAGNPLDHLVVIHNGVDTSEFYRNLEEGLAFRERFGLPWDATVVGLVAAHRREKRHDRFIRVMEALVAVSDQVWGLMVGGGPLLESNRAAASRSSAAHRIVVAGPQAHMRAAYSAIDIATLVSDSVETFPMCFLEAQACGCPVVGMDTSGVRSTFARSRSGFLVAQGDRDGMVESISQLIANRNLSEAMGQYARQWVSANLSLERMIDEYELVLTSAAAGKRYHNR